MKKQFLAVEAHFSPQGVITPRCIVWRDGRRFPIDQILDMRPAASLKAGGQGLRYTCRIRNSFFFLFLDQNQWFLERQAR